MVWPSPPNDLSGLPKSVRIAASDPDALARLAATQRKHAAAQLAWKPSDQPAWLTERIYVDMIQPRLRAISVSKVMSALGVSRPYAVAIRLSRRRPHPRHWRALAELATFSPVNEELGNQAIDKYLDKASDLPRSMSET